MERICRKCGQTFAATELVRGYEHEKGRYLPITTKELDAITTESHKDMVIVACVDPHDIAPFYFTKPYYLAPGEDRDEEYVLLRDVLWRTHKVALSKFVWYEREHMGMIHVQEDILMLEIMYFADELVSPQELAIQPTESAWGEQELELAEQLVGTLTVPFVPQQYKNTYSDELYDLIQRKRVGKPLKAKIPAPSPLRSVSLRERLKESIDEVERERRTHHAA
jgi:DNA end-binding protein Ku